MMKRAYSDEYKKVMRMIKVEQIKNDALTPEKQLMIAVLESAVDDIFSDTYEHGSNERETAIRWLNSDDEMYTFSFLPICDACGLSPRAIRNAVLSEVSKKRDRMQ